MFQVSCKTLGYMKIIVCKIPPGGGGGQNHIYPMAYNIYTSYGGILPYMNTFHQNMKEELALRTVEFKNIRHWQCICSGY